MKQTIRKGYSYVDLEGALIDYDAFRMPAGMAGMPIDFRDNMQAQMVRKYIRSSGVYREMVEMIRAEPGRFYLETRMPFVVAAACLEELGLGKAVREHQPAFDVYGNRSKSPGLLVAKNSPLRISARIESDYLAGVHFNTSRTVYGR